MLQIQLNEEERLTLQNLLDSCLSDLRMEISHTDNFRFKEMLRNRKDVLSKIKNAVASVPVAD
jgi:hypothetical protein